MADDKDSQKQLVLTQEIHQDVKQILEEQKLTAIFARHQADETLSRVFDGNLSNILVYLHGEEFKFNGSKLATELNKRYKKHGVALKQQKVSEILKLLRHEGLTTASKEYASGWGKYGLAPYLRKLLPPALRSSLSVQLDRIKRLP